MKLAKKKRFFYSMNFVLIVVSIGSTTIVWPQQPLVEPVKNLAPVKIKLSQNGNSIVKNADARLPKQKKEKFETEKNLSLTNVELVNQSGNQPANYVNQSESELEGQLIALQKKTQESQSIGSILSSAIDSLGRTEQEQLSVEQVKPFSLQSVRGDEQKYQTRRTPSEQFNIDQEDKKLLWSYDDNFIDEDDESNQTTILETQPLLSNIPEPYIDQDDEETIESSPNSNKKMYLGRAYNYAIIDEEKPRRFCVFVSPFFSFCSNNAFDNCGRSVPMSTMITGTNSFTVGDIFLESRLSAQGLLTTGAAGPNQQPQFGSVPAQQYLALLAPMQVNIFGSERSYGANGSFIYRFPVNSCQTIFAAVGLTVPVLCVQRSIGFTFEKGVLEEERNYADQNNTQREFTTRIFFSDFESVEDFLIRAVLEPKGIVINPSADKFGFGDISLFGLVDFGPAINHLDGLQFGVNLQFPTGNKANANVLWEPTLGNGGGVQLDLFSNVIANSGNVYLNPTLYIAGIFTFPYSASRRFPSIVSNSNNVSNAGLTRVTQIPGLIAPVYTNLFAKAFNEVDSFIPAFADNIANVRVTPGARGLIGIGDYVYFTQACDLRFGVFYDFSAKSADSLSASSCSTTFASQYGCGVSEYAHRLSWHGAYKLPCGEIMVGSQHIVAGKNVVKRNDFFVTAILTF